MILTLPFPDIDPVIFSVSLGSFDFALRWYALAYIAGLLLALWILKAALARPGLWPAATAPMTRDQADALLTWVILGVILGGRLGFVLFYQPGHYLSHPGDILKVWQGGMAFHGGLAGVVIAAALFCWRQGLPALSVADGMALATPPGLMFGRLANFINGELWGRPSTLPWAVEFPDPRAQICPPDWVGACARHPSQLYQAGLEGLLLGLVLLWLAFAKGALRTPGRVAGVFFVGYGLARFVVEVFRQPDAQFIGPGNPLGHALQLGPVGLTMGQILSLPMLVVGCLLLAWSARRPGPA
jgi:phosphatidylglycerol:prolipoprotein diacylglycerol transferase